jgi:tripartite-type tricarboxylate transporter receptor subunit TctC
MRITTFIKSVAVSATIALLSFGSALADTWPNQPITFIIPFAAGGGGDNTFRAFRDELAQELKQPVVVQNTVGAAGIIGTVALKQSSNDGYTLGMSMSTTIGTGQIFNDQLPYDYKTDFDYIGVIGEIPRGVFVSSNSPYNTIADLIAASKNGKDMSMGISTNSPDHVNAGLFNSATQGKSQLIPYSGNTNTMVVDLLGGRLDAVWQSLPAMNTCLQDQSCKLIALAGSTKHPMYPSVPTFKDVGYATINAPSYYGVIAPAGLTPIQLQALNQMLNKVISKPEISEKLLKMGVVVTPKNLVDAKAYHLSAVDVAKSSAKIINSNKK